MKQTSQTIKTLVIAVIIAGILGLITVMAMESFGIAGVKIWAICLTLIICGITATISLVVAEKQEYKTLGGAGMLVSGLVFILTATIILAEIGDAGFVKFVASLFIVSIGIAHMGLLHHFNLQNKYAHYARMTATIAITLFSILIIVRIFESFGFGYESLLYGQAAYKLMFGAFIIDLAATVLVPLCNRLQVTEKIDLNFDETPPVDQSERQEV